MFVSLSWFMHAKFVRVVFKLASGSIVTSQVQSLEKSNHKSLPWCMTSLEISTAT